MQSSSASHHFIWGVAWGRKDDKFFLLRFSRRYVLIALKFEIVFQVRDLGYSCSDKESVIRGMNTDSFNFSTVVKKGQVSGICSTHAGDEKCRQNGER
jgi:hypothetical protein